MNWALLQLVSYDIVAWLAFVAITIAASYFGRGPGIIAGHFVVALAILWLDYQWIRSAMAAPEWDGAPDMDAVFYIGVFLRVLLDHQLLR